MRPIHLLSQKEIFNPPSSLNWIVSQKLFESKKTWFPIEMISCHQIEILLKLLNVPAKEQRLPFCCVVLGEEKVCSIPFSSQKVSNASFWNYIIVIILNSCNFYSFLFWITLTSVRKAPKRIVQDGPKRSMYKICKGRFI